MGNFIPTESVFFTYIHETFLKMEAKKSKIRVKIKKIQTKALACIIPVKSDFDPDFRLEWFRLLVECGLELAHSSDIVIRKTMCDDKKIICLTPGIQLTTRRGVNRRILGPSCNRFT